MVEIYDFFINMLDNKFAMNPVCNIIICKDVNSLETVSDLKYNFHSYIQWKNCTRQSAILDGICLSDFLHEYCYDDANVGPPLSSD